jgi:hypothetical protein
VRKNWESRAPRGECREVHLRIGGKTGEASFMIPMSRHAPAPGNGSADEARRRYVGLNSWVATTGATPQRSRR